ncbi:MAG: ABC transporter permease [Chloroflexi bacterium]|nr:ABC transporter permease [Chloroflexota bacterium]
MEGLSALWAWFLDPAHWSGSDGIPNRVAEHLVISLVAVAIAIAIALPAGLYIGHTGRGAFAAISLANIGRAVPSYAVLVIAFPVSIVIARISGSDIAIFATLVAMVLLAIPPIVTNTFIGLREVDRDLVETARGMGMRGVQVLGRVEIPIGSPVLLAGLRTASVQVVATATLGAVIGGGGLGRYIIQGIARNDDERLVAGAVMVALLAIATELGFGALQRRFVSPGLAIQGPAGGAFKEVGQVPRPAGDATPL